MYYVVHICNFGMVRVKREMEVLSIPCVIIMDVAVYSKIIIKYTWEKVCC